MSNSESPPELTIDNSKEKSPDFIRNCEDLVMTEKGIQRVQHYARKYKKAGNDLDKLAEELAEIVGAE